MKINRIRFNNFRIYKGDNEIKFAVNSGKNINIIAGKNGFGKTTFLTSLIWVFYGKMMVEVEDKYKKDIKNAGGYEKYLLTLLNRDVNLKDEKAHFSVEIDIRDISIPSIPCQSVLIRRSYDVNTQKENLLILIDGLENELTKEVGYEVFINDFILPREIAKFFFFDAEKIVSLAEAKSKSELRNLSRAYSEVLGIKKYEDLKKNLETLRVKLRREGATPEQEKKLEELIEIDTQLKALIDLNLDKRQKLEIEIQNLVKESDTLQEKLVREGNGITVEELHQLRNEQELYRIEANEIKARLKKMLDLLPVVMAGKKLLDLEQQLNKESARYGFQFDNKAFENIRKTVYQKLLALGLEKNKPEQILGIFKDALVPDKKTETNALNILLDFTPEETREIQAIIDNVRNSFSIQFSNIVREEKNNRIAASKVYHKIKQAEARKSNPVAAKLREDKLQIDEKLLNLSENKGKLIEELSSLENRAANNSKILSEYMKDFNIRKIDAQKYNVTVNVLEKINLIIQRIKEDKKYSLQKSILLGLKKIMHKDGFVNDVKVLVQDDVIDIDLLDGKGNIIDKDSLSKGEQQLYATALLKALVDESGIKFPVFIDSPLQKFDKFHSKNIIKEFYPSISDQVVLFPLLEKELSEMEYEYLKPNVSKVFVIENKQGASAFKELNVKNLFDEVKKENYVYSN
ncbi:DNA sulfur modification protein DndD [Flavobacterium sp. D11R37]|uniref:DNA sulfur modification protein DndD n=1 Tax=Flavobacterium coralii TaxID=2838017 RepID=UPI001CA7AAC3|nr:DNA sulfur modification protein DndD [Flavobacterium coralii]MBY8961810.1 DNA sulfur modification protein DndD [Flavobacterium coralii]